MSELRDAIIRFVRDEQCTCGFDECSGEAADRIIDLIIEAGTIQPRQIVSEHTTGQGPTYRSVEAQLEATLVIPLSKLKEADR